MFSLEYAAGFKPKQGWQWDIAARKSAGFIKDVLPYLNIKQQQAEYGLEFQALISARNKRKYGPEDWALREGYKLALSQMKQSYAAEHDE